MAGPGISAATPGKPGHISDSNKIKDIVNEFDMGIGTDADENDVLTRVGGVYVPRPAAGGSGASYGWEVLFSSLTGANDDAKLDSFMDSQRSIANGQNRGAILRLDENRDYTFTQSHVLYNGFAMMGPHRPQDQARTSRPIGNRILLRPTVANTDLFTCPAGSIFGVSLSNLAFDGNANSGLVQGRPDGVLWTSNFRDISIQNSARVLGSASQNLLFTASSVDGWWNVNNVYDRAFCIGGSDGWFQPTMCLLDSPATGFMSNNEYLMSLDYLSNFWIDNIYCTAEAHSGLLLTGGNTTDYNSVWVRSSVWEGRNATASCPAALVRCTGGQFMMEDNRFAFAMTNPNSPHRADRGVIHVTGGNLTLVNSTYLRGYTVGTSTLIAETVPFVFATGANTRVRVRNVIAPDFTTGKPVVQQTQAGLIDADDTVTVVTAA